MSEAQFEAQFVARQARRLVSETEAELAAIANREATRLRVLGESGFDIGTRQQAITQTGPYSDQANLDRLALFFMEHGVGTGAL